MLRTVNALKARQNFGEMLEEVFYKNYHFLIKRRDKPMAVIVPISEYERWQRQREEDLSILDEIRERNKGFSHEEVERDVAQAVKEVREEKRRAHRSA